MAEIRLDLTLFEGEAIDTVFAHSTPTIATCRPDELGHKKQLELLSQAIRAGANYVDIEIEAPKEQQDAIVKLAREMNCRIIISYHNYEETPGLKELYEIADTCYELGADVAKLAVLTPTKHDAARVLSLYSIDKPIVALGMGTEGKITRIAATSLGAEFTFASMDEGEATAPGQIRYSEMKKLTELLNNPE